MFATNRVTGIDLTIASTLTVLAWLLYNLNGDFTPYHDTLVNILTAESLLRDRDILLTPEEACELMEWRVVGDSTSAEVVLTAYDDEVAKLLKEGALRLDGPDVILRESPIPGHYANIFGSGVGIVSAPFYAIAYWLAGPQSWEPKHSWLVGKWIGSAFSAFSVGFIFLAARVISPRWIAGLTAVVYAAGTGIFSISSQALWQHTPSQFFLALGLFLYLNGRGRAEWIASSSLALATSVWCRPTNVLLVAAIAGCLLIRGRRSAAIFILSGLPLGLALMWHNDYCFGSPWKFGQTELSNVATDTTGSPEIFQTPLLYGALAHLLSPSRGLVIYSPFLTFCLWGIWRVWHEPELVSLRPLSIGLLGMWLIEFKHFDWWGGWSYGYRHLVDTTTILILFLPPALQSIGKRKALWVAFFTTAGYSIGVQLIGAFSFDLLGWNNRQAEVVITEERTVTRLFDDYDFQRTGPQYVNLNVDEPANRHRLWSWSDSQILYYVWSLSPSRQLRRYIAERQLMSTADRQLETYAQLARAFERTGQQERAKQCHEQIERLKQTSEVAP